MTDTEINEAVARKLGWVQKGSSWQSPVQQEKYPEWSNIDLPDYCNEIAAVWEILTDYCDEWHLDCRGGVSARLQKNYVSGFAEADTAPMAICLAFLKLESSHGKNIKAKPDPNTRSGSKAPKPK